MTGTIFALVVALYGPAKAFSIMPHIYAVFQTAADCERAAVAWRAQTTSDKYKAAYAICVPQTPGAVLGPMVRL